jgi:hypothetical protein
MSTDRMYAWERYPEYVALQQFSRCLGRILSSLPRRHQRRSGRILFPAAVFMAQGIAGAHAELRPGEEMPLAEREQFRSIGLESLTVSRERLLRLKSRSLGSQPELLVALELLERVESGLRTRPLPGAAPE